MKRRLLLLVVLPIFSNGLFAQDTVRYPDRWYGYTPREALMEYGGYDTSHASHELGFDSSYHIVKSCNPFANYIPEHYFNYLRFVDPGTNQKMYGIAVTMNPVDFDTLAGSLLVYRGFNIIVDSAYANGNQHIIHRGNLDSIVSISVSNPPLMKQCVFEYDYSLPTVWSLYSNCYEFYFDEPIDLLPNYDTYIGFTQCGFDFGRLNLGRDTTRSQVWYSGCKSADSIEIGGVTYYFDYPYEFRTLEPIIFMDGKYVDYFKVPGYEDAYWGDCYWGMIFPILHPRCTAPKCVAYNGELVEWCGDPESEVFQVSLTGYPASPDSGVIATCNGTSFLRPDVLPDTVCVAYVRKMCTFEFESHTDTVWGDWSAPVVITGDTTGLGGNSGEGDDTLGIARVGMQPAVALTPNPASGKVTVAAEGMESVELVAVDGATVLRRECRGECTIDLTGLANGTYMVRVVTAKGVAARKLVVQR